MAYYLELDGVSGLAQCPGSLSLPSNFELNYDLFILANGSEDYFSSPFSGRGVGFLSGFVAFYASAQQVYFNYPSTGRPAINDIVNIRFTSTDNGDSTFTIRCYMSVNGGAEEQLNRAIGSDVFSQPLTPRQMEWGRRPNTLYRKVGVIRTRYYESAVLLNDWDFNQSSGNTAPDIVGGNDATATGGFSWVFYDDGQGGIVTADAAYTISAPAFTANASATLPQPTADGAFSIASPLFSASATATLPQPIADAAFTINAPTFAATASATIPGFNASVSFAIPAPTFSANATVTLPSPTADVSYTIAAPTFSVNASATLPQPSSDVAFTINSPSFAVTATATEPGFNASVNFTVNAPTFTADATATLPQPSADVGFTVSAPTFSVVAIVGGIAIIVDNETNINVPALATNINAPVLSNNMRI